MNEQIKQLWKEAAKTTQSDSWEEQTKFMERFAELIVRECLDACSRANEIRHFVPPTQEQVVLSCMREIEEHFGVEE
jgi:hypothetical protein